MLDVVVLTRVRERLPQIGRPVGLGLCTRARHRHPVSRGQPENPLPEGLVAGAPLIAEHLGEQAFVQLLARPGQGQDRVQLRRERQRRPCMPVVVERLLADPIARAEGLASPPVPESPARSRPRCGASNRGPTFRMPAAPARRPRGCATPRPDPSSPDAGPPSCRPARPSPAPRFRPRCRAADAPAAIRAWCAACNDRPRPPRSPSAESRPGPDGPSRSSSVRPTRPLPARRRNE